METILVASLCNQIVCGMAFDRTPAQSTYQTKQVNLFYEQNNRGSVATQDEDYVNVFIELVKNKETGDQDHFIVKRPGAVQYISSLGAFTIRGMHYNEDFSKLYYAVDNDIRVWDVANNVHSASLSNVFGTTSGDVGFCDYLYDSGGVAVIATDGTTLIQIDSANTVTTCVDADLPAHLPVPVFLDGYLFILKSGTADLYNSDLNDPMSWTPGNFITAEIGPDIARTLAKMNNYLLVFGSNTIEYFWDAGNATGSPLQRNDTPVKFNGYLGGLAQHGNKLYFVGNTYAGEASVFVVEDFKIDELGNPAVKRYLTSQTTLFSTYKGSILSMGGHTFYAMKAGNSLTYVLDLDTKLWARWVYQQGTLFDVTHAVSTKNSFKHQCFFALNGISTIYEMSPTIYLDNDTLFTCSGVTDNQYFDSYRNKFMSRLIVWADKPTSSAFLNISWTDNDYQSFNTPISVELAQERPSLNRLGSFRRRAFKWTYTANLPMRLKGFEVELNLGSR